MSSSTATHLLAAAFDQGFVSPGLMRQLRKAEGYRGMPYEDTLGKPTIGVGTLLPLTEDEAMLLAACRAGDTRPELATALGRIGIDLAQMPHDLADALVDMAFQLGVPRAMGFRRMWAAIANEDWNEAADEALDSKWARQTPVRARHLATVLRAQRGP